MSYRFTLMGLPFSGKTTLFDLLTAQGGSSGQKGNLRMGNVDVPDERLGRLADLFKSKKVVPTRLEFIDILLSMEGNSGGIGETLLGQIRASDAIVIVIGCFDDKQNYDNASSDIDNVHTELLASDLEVAQKRLERLQHELDRGVKTNEHEKELLEKIVSCLSDEKFLNSFPMNPEQLKIISSFAFLTLKPIIHVLNISDDLIKEKIPPSVTDIVKSRQSEVIAIACKIEKELLELPEDEQELFRDDLGLKESAVPLFIQTAYKVLNVTTFLTTGEDESRAWTIPSGTKAQPAAGRIHSDIERGFIRAEVVPYSALIESASYAKAREKGVLRLEGKEYVVQEGDVINFRFNV